MFCNVWKQRAYPLTTLAILLELPSGLDNPPAFPVTTTPESLYIYRLSIHPGHIGFVIERIDMAGPPIHKQKNDGLGFGCKVWWLGR